jgi:hypothetical protein
MAAIEEAVAQFERAILERKALGGGWGGWDRQAYRTFLHGVLQAWDAAASYQEEANKIRRWLQEGRPKDCRRQIALEIRNQAQGQVWKAEEGRRNVPTHWVKNVRPKNGRRPYSICLPLPASTVTSAIAVADENLREAKVAQEETAKRAAVLEAEADALSAQLVDPLWPAEIDRLERKAKECKDTAIALREVLHRHRQTANGLGQLVRIG